MSACAIQQKRITVAGYRAHLFEAGSGPTVVLLPSMFVLARSYRPTLERLAREYHVIAVELPGSGRASRLAWPWNLEQYACWLISCLDALRLERVTLIGHSNSGPVAMIAAVRAAHRIARLVLADTIGGDPSRGLLRVLLARGVDAVLEPKLTLRAWHHVAYNALVHPRTFLEQVRLAAAADLRPYAHRVQVPTLLAWGARDHTMPLSSARLLRGLLPNSTLYISRTGSHDWLITNAHEFASALTQFTTPSARIESPHLLRNEPV